MDIDHNIETITSGEYCSQKVHQQNMNFWGKCQVRRERNTRSDRKISIRCPRQKEIVFSTLAQFAM